MGKKISAANFDWIKNHDWKFFAPSPGISKGPPLKIVQRDAPDNAQYSAKQRTANSHNLKKFNWIYLQ